MRASTQSFGTSATNADACTPVLAVRTFLRTRIPPSFLHQLHHRHPPLNASAEDWVELLTAWLRLQAGRDDRKVDVVPKKQKPGAEPETDLVVRLFEDLNSNQRAEILFALQHPEIITVLTRAEKSSSTSHAEQIPPAPPPRP